MTKSTVWQDDLQFGLTRYVRIIDVSSAKFAEQLTGPGTPKGRALTIEMEEKMQSMIKLIDEDADSFAKRAEMYYKRRPELISFVEEAFRTYKALADRYDHISGELHKANHTLATLFPEQFQHEMQQDEVGDDGGFCYPKAAACNSPGGASRHFRMPTPDSLQQQITPDDDNNNKTGPIRRKSGTSKSSFASPIDKDKAQEETDRLQKDILVLQDEFHATSQVIEDDEARALMAATALKSCEDTLINLKQQLHTMQSETHSIEDPSRSSDARGSRRTASLSAVTVRDSETFHPVRSNTCIDRSEETRKGSSPSLEGLEGNEDAVLGCGIEQQAWLAMEERFRRDIDALMEENMNFWLRFSTSYHQIQQFKTTFQGLKADIETLKDSQAKEGGGSTDATAKDPASSKKESAPLDKKLRDLRTEEEISKVLRYAESKEDQFTAYQALKFQGEIANMQQENKKVEAELHAGLDYVRNLQADVLRELSQLHKGFDLPSGDGGDRDMQLNHLSAKNSIPLRTFLFGGSKPKKPSIFACMNP